MSIVCYLEVRASADFIVAVAASAIEGGLQHGEVVTEEKGDGRTRSSPVRGVVDIVVISLMRACYCCTCALAWLNMRLFRL